MEEIKTVARTVIGIENRHHGFSCNGKITSSRVKFSDGTEATYILRCKSDYYRDRQEIPEERHADLIGKTDAEMHKLYRKVQ
jgi:hypothetical protein